MTHFQQMLWNVASNVSIIQPNQFTIITSALVHINKPSLVKSANGLSVWFCHSLVHSTQQDALNLFGTGFSSFNYCLLHDINRRKNHQANRNVIVFFLIKNYLVPYITNVPAVRTRIGVLQIRRIQSETLAIWLQFLFGIYCIKLIWMPEYLCGHCPNNYTHE